MKMTVKFEKDGVELTSFSKELAAPEDFVEADREARDLFYKQNPGVLLMDGVTVHYGSE